jgi:hypothetical protein
MTPMWTRNCSHHNEGCACLCYLITVALAASEVGVANAGAGTVAFSEYTLWDADRVFGCLCDRGYTSGDCSVRE